jgi:hypothetical protein
MKARGKREAQRNASPLVTRIDFEASTESAKYQRQIIPLFQRKNAVSALSNEKNWYLASGGHKRRTRCGK